MDIYGSPPSLACGMIRTRMRLCEVAVERSLNGPLLKSKIIFGIALFLLRICDQLQV
jgi:hypothetical protein